MNDEYIFESDDENVAENLSLIFQRDSRRLSTYIDAEKEASV